MAISQRTGRWGLPIAIALALVCLAPLLNGCVSAETVGPRRATGVWGYVAASKNATISIDPAHSNVASVVATRVVAPADGFILATAAREGTATGMQVGLVPVKSGESTQVLIPIMGARSGAVVLTLYVDRNHNGHLDSEPMSPASSPDRPVFVDGKPVTVSATLVEAEAPMGAGAALLDVFDQPKSKKLNVTHVVTPGPSWIAVYADENGVPGRLLGQLSIPATDAIGVAVPLASAPTTAGVFVELHVDDSVIGTYEYQRSTATSVGPDAPYVVGGGEVIKHAYLR
jgi:hypothetical protein